ncbi:AcrR family transcriptional regulator [Rhodoligotrophos appendicifer]|uniref:TetR/AcrR family transcriptional regulator n=1 Tax=Rhodoligotrophos appendicifer TaxID=987056 RepID=UPI00117FEF1F|nr:TetR family transcriptional regulator [Rhodoligotrophos appendicifer]
MAGEQKLPRQRRLNHADRRQQLTEAAIRCMAKNGPSGTSVRQICREAGVSPGLLNYFFPSFKEIFLSCYLHITSKFESELLASNSSEFNDPESELHFILNNYLSPEWVNSNIISAYITLWAFSQNEPELKKAMTESHQRQIVILSEPLRKLARARSLSSNIEVITESLIIFLNGIWLEMGLNPSNLPPEKARKMLDLWIRDHFDQRPIAH